MTNVEEIDNQLNEAIHTLKAEDSNRFLMTGDELVEFAARGMEEVSLLREANTVKLIAGREHFTALVNQLAVSEADLAKRYGIYTAMLATVEPVMADD
jgi:hypothetical protein